MGYRCRSLILTRSEEDSLQTVFLKKALLPFLFGYITFTPLHELFHVFAATLLGCRIISVGSVILFGWVLYSSTGIPLPDARITLAPYIAFALIGLVALLLIGTKSIGSRLSTAFLIIPSQAANALALLPLYPHINEIDLTHLTWLSVDPSVSFAWSLTLSLSIATSVALFLITYEELEYAIDSFFKIQV